MKILQLCNKPPFPPKDGGCIAMYAVTQGLLEKGVEVRILTAFSKKHPFEKGTAYAKVTQTEAVFFDLDIHFWGALRNLLTSKRSYVSERFRNSLYAKKLREILRKETFDIIQIESIFMAQYIPIIRKYSKAKLLIRAHNAEHLIWERMAGSTKLFFKKNYLRLLASRLKKEEIYWISKADALLPITEKDAAYFKALGSKLPIHVLAFGISDTLLPKQFALAEENSLFFIGSLQWMPNLEGLDWFLEEVWPEINRLFPAVNFYVAGRAMPDYFLNANYPNVIFMGEIPDAKAFMLSKRVMIVPLLSGSGVRVKIIEGMTYGKMVITSSLGAEGIDYTDRENIWIAETAEDYLEALHYITENPEKLVEIGENARELMLRKHSNHVITEELIKFYKTLM